MMMMMMMITNCIRLHGSNHYSVWHKKIFALAVDCSLASFSFFLIGGVTRNNVILFIINIKKHSL